MEVMGTRTDHSCVNCPLLFLILSTQRNNDNFRPPLLSCGTTKHLYFTFIMLARCHTGRSSNPISVNTHAGCMVLRESFCMYVYVEHSGAHHRNCRSLPYQLVEASASTCTVSWSSPFPWNYKEHACFDVNTCIRTESTKHACFHLISVLTFPSRSDVCTPYSACMSPEKTHKLMGFNMEVVILHVIL